MTMLRNGDAQYSELCLHLRIFCVAQDYHFIYSALFVACLKLCSSCVRVCRHAACLGVRRFYNSSLRCHLNPCFLFSASVWFSLLDSDQEKKNCQEHCRLSKMCIEQQFSVQFFLNVVVLMTGSMTSSESISCTKHNDKQETYHKRGLFLSYCGLVSRCPAQLSAFRCG